MTASLLSVSVPGSHSKVISSARSHGVMAFSRFTSPCSCVVERNDGVPPPNRRNSTDDPRWPAARVKLPFVNQRVEVLDDIARVLVGIDPEVAEVTALPAERHVQVKTERHARRGGACSAGSAPRATPRRVQTENGG